MILKRGPNRNKNLKVWTIEKWWKFEDTQMLGESCASVVYCDFSLRISKVARFSDIFQTIGISKIWARNGFHLRLNWKIRLKFKKNLSRFLFHREFSHFPTCVHGRPARSRWAEYIFHLIIVFTILYEQNNTFPWLTTKMIVLLCSICETKKECSSPKERKKMEQSDRHITP